MLPPQMYQCPYCKYSNADVNRLRVHAMTQHSVQPLLRCPLCQDMLNNKIHLQLHLTHLHSVAPDCVEKLIMTVRQPGRGPCGLSSFRGQKSCSGNMSKIRLLVQKAAVELAV